MAAQEEPARNEVVSRTLYLDPRNRGACCGHDSDRGQERLEGNPPEEKRVRPQASRFDLPTEKGQGRREKAEGSRATRNKAGVFAAVRRLFGKVQARAPKRSIAELESQIHDIDEILFNLDSCKVQIEGKLLSLS